MWLELPCMYMLYSCHKVHASLRLISAGMGCRFGGRLTLQALTLDLVRCLMPCLISAPYFVTLLGCFVLA